MIVSRGVERCGRESSLLSLRRLGEVISTLAFGAWAWLLSPGIYLANWRMEVARSLASLQISYGEAAIVGLQLLLLGSLSIYGAHRLVLLAACRRRKSAPPPPPPPHPHMGALPRVTVQAPVYNERFVVEDLIESLCRLEYPRDRLEIQILDDSTDETTEIVRRAVERQAALGAPIRLLHRPHREGFKAGALAAGLDSASGDLTAIFDADFAPPPDFLLRAVPYFNDAEVGAVQGRWTHQNRDASLLTRVQAVLIDAHFVVEQGARSADGLFFNFNGTAGVLRRSMIDDAGGWQSDTLTEDADLSYRAQLRGWKFLYLDDLEAPSQLPSELESFQRQQARWAKGLTQTALKLLPALWRSGQPWRIKVEGVMHLTANFAFPAMALLSAIALPASMARADADATWLQAIDAALFLFTSGALMLFYALPQLELHGVRWLRRIWLLPAALAIAVALTLSNTRAVIEALRGVDSPFERTFKNHPLTGGSTAERGRGGWLPRLNLAVGVYFIAAMAYAAWSGSWALTPFLAPFAAGYLYAGAAAWRSVTARLWAFGAAKALARRPARSSA